MSDSTPQRQPTITEIDSEVYRRLCDVVKDGTFESISFSPWHKGCDTELHATCHWPELEGELEMWYYDRRGECDIDMHTMAIVNPHYDGERLSFHLDAIWDRSMDQMSEVAQGWDEMEFQEFVHSLLPSTMEEDVTPEDLWISLELEYESPSESSISGFSISLSGDENEDLTAAITPENQKLIGDHVIAWCMENHSPEDSFSVSIENNEVASVVSSYPSEEFLIVPKGAKEAGS